MKPRTLSVGILTLISLLLPMPATLAQWSPDEEDSTQRSEVPPPDDPIVQMTRDADAIIVGKVISSRSYWSTDNTIILTDHSVVSTNTLRGHAPNMLTITTEGGEIGSIGLKVSHELTLHRNASYVLFLTSRSGRLSVMNGTAGCHKVDSSGPEQDATFGD
ncbi:MAG: hypothetical protein ACKVRP_05430 [Bacteroidota bacterium]